MDRYAADIYFWDESGFRADSSAFPDMEPVHSELAGFVFGPADRNRTCIWRLGGARSIH